MSIKVKTSLLGLSLVFLSTIIPAQVLAKNETSNSWNLKKVSAPYTGATIRVLGEDLPPLHSLEKLKYKFEQETGTKLEIDMKNHSSVIQSILEGILSKDYKYDLVFVPRRELGRLAVTKSMIPLKSFYNNPKLRDPSFNPDKQLFSPFWSEVSKYNNEWYALPLYMGGSVIVYRNDLLSNPMEKNTFKKRYNGTELKVPQNTNEWLRLAQFFHRPNNNPSLYGNALLLSDESLWYEWYSALLAFNGKEINQKHSWEYGDIVVNSPEAIKATEFYKKLSRYSPPDSTNYSWGLGIAKQQAGVNFMTLLEYDVLSEFESPQKTKYYKDLNYFLPPKVNGGYTSQMESWVGFIPTTAKSPQASWLLLQWMMNNDIQVQMHLEGNISPSKKTYENPKVKKMRSTDLILKSVKVMQIKPNFPEASAIADITSKELQRYFRNEVSAKEALDNAAKKIKDRLGDKAKLKYPVK